MSYKLAALADHVYHRAGTGVINGVGDQAINLSDIGYASLGDLDPALEAIATAAGLTRSQDGFFYNTATGFVGTIVKDGDDFVIAYRGTDAGNATFIDDVAAAILTGSGDAEDIDNNDMQNNRAIGGGSLSDTGQHQDAFALAEIALQLAGDDPSKITVTGQSLGGGLAGVVGAVHGFDTYIVAPAPFKKQLAATSHYLAALKETLEAESADTVGYASLADYLKPEFWDQSTEHRVYLLDHGAYQPLQGPPVTLESFIVDEIHDLNSATALNAVLDELRTSFDTIQSDKLTDYNKQVANDPNDGPDPKFEIHTIEGEILSSGEAEWIAEVFADHFDTPHQKYNIGEGNGWNLGTTFGSSYVGFHSPSLHALVIRTEETDKKFSDLLKSDAQLRHIFTENGASAGPIAHNRTDEVQSSSSAMQLGYSDTTILYRALWKAVTQDANFWNYFYTLYSDIASAGAAAEGIQATTSAFALGSEPSVHSGVLQLSLSVLRDGLQDTQSLGDVKGKLGLNLGMGSTYAFAGSEGNLGVLPRGDRIIVDTTAIKQLEAKDHDDNTPFKAVSGRALGVSDIDHKIVASAATGIFGTIVGDRADTALYLGANYQQVVKGEDALKPWQVLVVQGGAGTGSFVHDVLTDSATSLVNKSHVIIAGAGDDELTGSTADDYLIGADGENTFFGTSGADIIVGGADDDTFKAATDLGNSATTFIGGMGTDTADYTDAASPVTVKQKLEQVGSQLIDAFDVRILGDSAPDILFGAEKIVGTDGAVDTLDFSDSAGPIYYGQGGATPGSYNLYGEFDTTLYQNNTVVGIDLGTVVKQGKGFTNPETEFLGFEKIIGSSASDVISVVPYSGGGGGGGGGGGWGDDHVFTIEGGDGNDFLHAGKTKAIIDGGIGNDTIHTSGTTSLVYGGADQDTFKLGPNTFVMDATDEEWINFGPFSLTGGIQFGWQEGAFAYWQPFSALAQGARGGLAGMFAEFWTTFSMDVQFMSWMRYAQTDSGQLIAQMGRGYGEIIVEGYEMVLETGRAVGNISVFAVDMVEGVQASMSAFAKFIDLALQAGFGVRAGSYDPLVIDLDKDGLDLTRQNQGDVYFDLDNDGFAERTGWVREDDGLLAIDLNSDGEINNITELFGDENTSGLLALAAYDSNGDGVINAQDAQFSDLLIWQDLNQNGIADPGELSDLATHGIVEISLTGRDPDTTVLGGNDIREVADVTFSDGSTSIAGDVWFDVNQIDSKYLGDTTVSSAAAALPILRGFGDMTSLQVAMTSDAALLNLVTDFTLLPATSTWADYTAATSTILIDWADVAGVAADPLGTDGFDLQKLAYLETSSGLLLAPRDEVTGDVLDTNAGELLDTWNEAVTNQTGRLLFQAQFSSYLSDISYDAELGIFQAAAESPTALADTFTNLLAALPADPIAAEQMWSSTFGPAISAAITIMKRHDGINMRSDFVAGQLVLAHDASIHDVSLGDLMTGLGLDNVIVDGPYLRGSAEGTVVYVGTAGNDTFQGGNAQDVYVFDSVIGHDTIIDAETGHTPWGDRLRFVHLNEDDVEISRDGVDLVITVSATGETVRVQNQFVTPEYNQAGRQISNNWGIEDIQFADGTIFEAIDIGAAVNKGSDTTADHIIGTGFDDEINGGLLDDILEGGDGGDFYVYQAGGGHDIIRDEMTNPFNDRQDLLMLTDGLSLDDMRYERIGNSDDLTIRFSDDPNDTNSILIEGQFAYSGLGYDNEYALDQRIEGFGSLEDAPINWVDVQQRVIETYTTSGNDVTFGFGTSDLFISSAGDDWLSGGDSGDIYEFGFGSGHDTIEDNQIYQRIFLNVLPGSESLGSDDYLAFGDGITVADVTFSVVDGTRDLLISIDDDPAVAGASDTMRIVNQFDGQRIDLFSLFDIAWFDRVEQFVFGDGTVLTWEDILDIVTVGDAGDNSLIGDHRADTLVGNEGNDHLSGGDDSDTYVYNLGDGNDIIEDNQHDIFTPSEDILQFGAGITSSDVSFSYGPSDNDVLLSLTDGSTITLVNQLAGYDSHIFGINWTDRIETLEFTDAQGQVVETIGWDAIMTALVAQQQTAGDDTINGIDSDFGAWSDIIDAGAGNDTIFGRGGHDTITGGTGDDTSDGGWGNDTYIFNPGDGIDTIQDTGSGLDSADKLIIGYNVADVSVARPAGTNNIVLTFAGSTDQITVINALSGQAESAIETYEFLDATWTPVSIAQSLVDGQVTEGADVIIGTGVVNGLGGNDLIWGEGAADTLSGGLGDDFLDGGAGTDTYLYSAGDGHDTIQDIGNGLDTDDLLQITGYTRAQTTIEVIDGLNQIDLVFTGSGDRISLINPLDSTASFRGINLIEFVDEGVTWTTADLSALVVTAQATSGDDQITGSGVGDVIDGGAGDDDIDAGSGEDDISGGAGNDRLEGGTHNDTYRFGQGDGQDTITDTGNGLDWADRLIISDYLSSQTIVQRVAGTENILLTFAGSTDSITLVKALTGSYLNQIETYEFTADGTLWTPTDLAAQILLQEVTAGDDDLQGFDTADVISGGVGNDSIHGHGGDDTISGDIGDDFLNGGKGDDVFFYTIGDGHDTIHDQGDGLDTSDILKISGYTSAQTTIEIVDGMNQIDLVFTLDGDRISLINPLDSFASLRGINLIEFVDEGVTWNSADLSAAVMAAQSTPGDDMITGSDVNDIISGGLGNDTIDGGTGNDTYLYSAGDGHDTIDDNGNGLDTSDILKISGYTRAQTTIEIVNGMSQIDLVFTGTGDRISLIDALVTSPSFRGINLIEFVDEGVTWDTTDLGAAVMAAQSTSGDDTITGSDIDDIITGGLGNDTIDGGKGDDTFIFNLGDGHDTIADNGDGLSNDDRLIINGYLVEDVIATGIGGNDVELTFAGTSDKITLLNAMASGVFQTIDYYEFVSGGTTTVWTKQDLIDAVASSSAVTHLGTTGVDIISGSTGDDVINGLAGDDTLNGKAGADVYLYASGDGNDTIDDDIYALGDVLRFTDLNAADVQLSKSGNDLLIKDLTTGQTITDLWHFYSTPYWGVETIEFADGSSWDYAQISEHAWIRGTAANETLTGSTSADTLDGQAGNDTLKGKAGDDVYIYSSGDGDDTIDEGVYAVGDVLRFTDLNAADVQLSKSVNDLFITDVTTGQVITDKWHFYSTAHWGIETIEFADGSSWDYETIGAVATIGTTALADTASGTTGDDLIIGLAGDDTLTGLAGADTFVFAAGDGSDTITDFSVTDADRLDVSAYGLTSHTGFTGFNFNGTDTVVDFNGTDQVTVAGVDLTTLPNPDDVFIFT